MEKAAEQLLDDCQTSLIRLELRHRRSR